jgi:hypothetical protein
MNIGKRTEEEKRSMGRGRGIREEEEKSIV